MKNSRAQAVSPLWDGADYGRHGRRGGVCCRSPRASARGLYAGRKRGQSPSCSARAVLSADSGALGGGGLTAGVEHDQQAGDDATVDLDLDAIRFCGQEVAAAEKLLEHPEEVLNQPP
jgi:hypothetical protein